MTKEEYEDELEDIMEIVEKVEAELYSLVRDAEDVEGEDRSLDVAGCRSDAEDLANKLEGIILGFGI